MTEVKLFTLYNFCKKKEERKKLSIVLLLPQQITSEGCYKVVQKSGTVQYYKAMG